MHPRRSKQIPARLQTYENCEKLRENFAKTSRKLRERRVRAVVDFAVKRWIFEWRYFAVVKIPASPIALDVKDKMYLRQPSVLWPYCSLDCVILFVETRNHTTRYVSSSFGCVIFSSLRTKIRHFQARQFVIFKRVNSYHPIIS